MEKLINDVIKTAKGAADIINFYQQSDLQIDYKKDDSPITQADTNANNYILEGLKQISPDLPILSEETIPIPEYLKRKQWSRYWLVDPLDGTREYIKGGSDFVINIALIDKHKPVLGVIYVPSSHTCYYACENQSAYKLYDGKVQRIFCNKERKDELTIIMGSSKAPSERLLKKLDQIGPYKLLSVSSAVKFCYVAEGIADIYLRLYPTYEWDTAPGQCILSEAGGKSIDLEKGTILSYNSEESLVNPYFIAGAPWAIERFKKWL